MKVKFVLLKKNEKHKYFCIRLTDDGKRLYEIIKQVPFTVDDWKYTKSPRKNELKVIVPPNKTKATDEDRANYERYKQNKLFIESLEKKYTDAIDALILLKKPFSFEAVKKQITAPEASKEIPRTFFAFYLYRIGEMKADKKFGNADNYKGTYTKFKKFHKKELLFNELTDDLLLEFKKQLLNAKLSPSTISIHLRNIRAIYRKAIKLKVADLSDYPFSNDDITKGLKVGYSSRAITKDEVNQIRNLKKELEEGSDVWHACNYFIFGYAGWGINFQDIARLKWSNRNMKTKRITYVRYKTRSKISTEISFPITPEIAEILAWYRTNDVQLNNPYIFPVLGPTHRKEVTIYNRIKKVRKEVNKSLKTIGEMIGTDVKLTTYVWRHSHAAIAYSEMGVSYEKIGESLGHHSFETAKAYVGQFGDPAKDEAFANM